MALKELFRSKPDTAAPRPNIRRLDDDEALRAALAKKAKLEAERHEVESRIIALRRGVPMEWLEERDRLQAERDGILVTAKDDRDNTKKSQRSRELRKKLREINDRINNPYRSRGNTRPPSEVEREARELLGLDPGPESDVSTIEALDHRLKVLTEAVELADRQIQAERERAVARLREEVEPGYLAIVDRLTAALETAGRLADEEAAYRSAIDASGASSDRVLPFRAPLNDFRLSLPTNKVNRWLDHVSDSFGITIETPRAARGHKPGVAKP